ncbi:hypothetical protein AB0J35_36035 [Nonomuraea angiospora]|uniref:hypothetical protein n=1 Tax=Nonomuraea angiospora TaxID=46172 RepID=UPI00341C8A5B
MRSVVVVPGGNFGPQAGLLAYVGQAAARRGGALELIWWTPPAGRALEDYAPWVYEQVAPVVDGLPAPLLIGKSLGSLGAAVAADHGMCLPGPLHRSAEVLGRVTTAVEAFLDDVVWR